MTVAVRANGVAMPTYSTAVPALTADFDLAVPVGVTALRYEANISGTGDIEIENIDWHMVPRPVGPNRVIS